MRLLTRLTSVFGGSKRNDAGTGPTQPRPGVFTPATRPSQPVRIDIEPEDADDPDAEGDDEFDLSPRSEGAGARRAIAPAASPRSKQELLQELQKNYAEVMTLIRKVSDHLDSESERSRRLMEIAERIPSALETLPELRRQNASILETLRQTAEEARGSDAEMASSLRSMSQRMEESRESDRQLVGTLAEFRGSLREMSDSSERTGVAIEQMNVRNEAREAELNSILELTKRWIVIASVVGLVGVAAATAAIIMLFVRGS